MRFEKIHEEDTEEKLYLFFDFAADYGRKLDLLPEKHVSCGEIKRFNYVAHDEVSGER